MTKSYFDTLTYMNKLLLLEHECPEVAKFITWANPIQHIAIFAVDRFYAEMVFDLGKRKVEAINSFETVDYLKKHRCFIAIVEGKIRGFNENHHY